MFTVGQETPVSGAILSIFENFQDLGPFVGDLLTSTRPDWSTATQSVGLGHETELMPPAVGFSTASALFHLTVSAALAPAGTARPAMTSAIRGSARAVRRMSDLLGRRVVLAPVAAPEVAA